jgi:integrase
MSERIYFNINGRTPDNVVSDSYLYKRKTSKVWWYYVKIPKRPRVYASTHTREDDLAVDYGRKILADVLARNAAGVSLKETQFGEAVELFIEYREGLVNRPKPLRSAKALYNIKNIIGNHILPYFGSKSMQEITVRDIERYKTQRMESGKISPTSLNIELGHIRAIFNYSRDKGLITPVEVPPVKKVMDKPNVRPAFTSEEFKHIIHAALVSYRDCPKYPKKPKYYKGLLLYAIGILGNTGMRVGELCNLQWHHIDQDMMSGIRENAYLYIFNIPDGKTGARPVVGDYPVWEFVDDLSDHMSNRHLIQKINYTSSYLMSNFEGTGVVRAENISKAFGKLIRTMKIENNADGELRSLYSLRHMYITEQCKSGINIHILSKNVGSSVAHIEKHYDKSISLDHIQVLTKRTESIMEGIA